MDIKALHDETHRLRFYEARSAKIMHNHNMAYVFHHPHSLTETNIAAKIDKQRTATTDFDRASTGFSSSLSWSTLVEPYGWNCADIESRCVLPAGFTRPLLAGFAWPLPAGFARLLPAGFARPLPADFARPLPAGFARPLSAGFAWPLPVAPYDE